MTVAFDAISTALSGTAQASGTNRNASITIGASATVAVCFLEASLSGGNSDASITFPTLTLGNTPMTQVPSARVHSGGGTTGFVDMYQLLNPPTGVQTLSITMNHSGTPGNVGNILAHVISFTGALSSGAEFGTAKTNSSTAGTSSLSISDTLANGDLFVGVACNGTSAPTITTGTSRGTITGDTSTASHGGIRDGDNSGTGSVSLTFGVNSADNSGCCGVKLVAASVAPSAPSVPIGTAMDTSVALFWTDGSDGGAAITSHDVDWALASAPTSWLGPVSTSSTAMAYTKTGLTNGTGYVFRVRAVNSIGNGSWSGTSDTVTPLAAQPQVLVPLVQIPRGRMG